MEKVAISLEKIDIDSEATLLIFNMTPPYKLLHHRQPKNSLDYRAVGFQLAP